MASNEKDLKLKLSATGGDAAAKEVRKVEEAVSDLGESTQGAATTGALGVDMSQLVPAWEQAAEAGQDLAQAGEDVSNGWGQVPVQLSTTSRLAAELKERGDATTQTFVDMTAAAENLAGTSGSGGLAAVIGRGGNVLGVFERFAARAAVYYAAFKVGWEGAKLLIGKLDEIKAASERSLPTLERTSQAAAVEAAALANATDLAADRARDAEAAYDAYAQKLRQIARDEAALTDAQLGADLAQIDLDELTGKLSEAEAIQARFDAKREAAARKRAAEIAAIEEELKNRQQQNAFDLKAYQDSLDPARAAQAELDVLTGKGAMSAAGLEDQARAVRDAQRARGTATTTDPEELDALDQAIKDTQKALDDAFEAMVADAIKKRDEAVAATKAAADKFNAGRADERSLTERLASETGGTGADTFSAAQREAEIRNRIEQERLRMQQERDAEKARADAERAQADAINQQAADLAAQIEAQIAAAPNKGADTSGLLPALQGIAAALQDGTSAAELADLSTRLANLVAGLGNEQAAARNTISALGQRVAQLESQFANRPGR